MQGTLTQIQEQVSAHGSICSRNMHALADLGNTNVQKFYGQASLFVHETEEVGNFAACPSGATPPDTNDGPNSNVSCYAGSENCCRSI
jgi:hypothetical protein